MKVLCEMPGSKIVLIACGKTKHHLPIRAAELYRGPLFKKSLAYAHTLLPKNIYILSAKHGLLELDDCIEPYELTLNKMTSGERLDWSQKVIAALKQKTDLNSDHFVFLAGLNYRRYLQNSITNSSAPLEGLGIGRQLSWLTR